MSDEAPSKSGKTWLYVAGMFALPPLLYVLSVGPAVVLQKRGLISSTSLHFFFDPLARLVNTAGVGNAFANYLDFWMTMTNTPTP